MSWAELLSYEVGLPCQTTRLLVASGPWSNFYTRWFVSLCLGNLSNLCMLIHGACQFIHAQADGTPVGDAFKDWIASSRVRLGPADEPAIDLGLLIVRFLEQSAFVRNHVVIDGRPNTASTLQKMLDLDAEFSAWEDNLTGPWLYRTETSQLLPPMAVFQGEYHFYYDLFFARMWNHYRWARILLNEMILDFTNNNPLSGLPLLPVLEQFSRVRSIQKLCKDMLVSTPCHWRHPLLSDNPVVFFEQLSGAGSGAAGVPVLLFHIKTAACASGIPVEYWEWGLGVIECIWSDMGMLHAKSMMELMRAHRSTSVRPKANGIMVS